MVEDAGEIVKISNDDLNPHNFYMVVDTTYYYGKEEGSINPYFQDSISTIVNKIRGGFNKTILARGILSDSTITTHNSIGYEIVSQDDGTLDAIVYYNDLHPLYLSSSKNTITLLEGWEEPAPLIPPTDQPHMQLVTDADGKAKWEDRLAYDYIEHNVMLVDNASVEVDSSNWSARNAFELKEIVAGEKYTVTVDGTEYVCKAVDVSSVSGLANLIIIGNAALYGDNLVNAGFPDTGEPFVIEWNSGSNTTWFKHQNASSTYNVTVAGPQAKIKTIPAKCVPVYDAIFDIDFADGREKATLDNLTVVCGNYQSCYAVQTARFPVKALCRLNWYYGCDWCLCMENTIYKFDRTPGDDYTQDIVFEFRDDTFGATITIQLNEDGTVSFSDTYVSE